MITNIFCNSPLEDKEKIWRNLVLSIFFSFAMSILIAVVFFAFDLLSPIVVFFSLFLLFLLASYFIFIPEKEKVLSPFFYFSCLYLFIPPSLIFINFDGVNRQHFTSGLYFRHDSLNLLEFSALFYCLGYFLCLIGFYSIVRTGYLKDRSCKIESSSFLLKPFLNLIACMGLASLFYHFYSISNGSFVQYFINVSLLGEKSDLGFIGYGLFLLYIALYGNLYLLKIGEANKIWLVVIFIACIFMKVASGRIFQTLSFFMVVMMFFYSSLPLKKRLKSKRFIFYFFLLLVFAGLTLYSFRNEAGRASKFSHEVTLDSLMKYFGILSENLVYYALQKGNIPNIPIFMKIIDSYDYRIGYENGKTIVYGVINNLLPSRWRLIDYQVSIKVKNIWFGSWPGGALPPTILGEFYANFGVLGILFGMFTLGLFMAVLKNFWYISKNPWFSILYWQLVIGFVLILPKGEFDNFPGQYLNLILVSFVLCKIVDYSGKILIEISDKNEIYLFSFKEKKA